MITLVLSAAFALAIDDDAKEEMVSMAKALVEAESYTFSSLSDGGGGFGGGRGGRGGGGRGGRGGDQGGAEAQEEAPKPIDGAYQKGQPIHLKQGDAELYRIGEDNVAKGEDGKWALIDMEAMRGGGRGGRGGGGGGGGAGGGAGAFAGMRTAFALMRAQLPHETLADLSKNVSDVAKSEKDGAVHYVATLTKEGVQAMGGGFGRRGGRGGGGGGGGDEENPFEYTGSVTMIAKGDAIESITIETRMVGSFGDREIDRKTKSTITVSKLGETEIKVPEAVLAQLEI